MKQFYTFLKGALAALLLCAPSLAPAHTLADLAGNWTLTAAEVAFGNNATEALPPATYDVTITVDEASSTAYFKGFPGTDVTPADGLFQGKFSTSFLGGKLSMGLPEGSKVTLADGATIGHSADTDDTPWTVQQNNKTKAITIKQPSGDDLIFTYTKGETSTTLIFSGIVLKQKAGPTYTAAPADLAGTYTIATGAATFDGDTESITTTPATTYKGAITVNEKGEACLTGFIGTPSKEDAASGAISDSCYVGKYDAAAKTLTFSYPDGFFMLDSEYNAWQLKSPFTVSVGKNSDDKYVLSTDGNIVFNFMGENEGDATCTFAGVTLTQRPSYTIAKEDLVGDWELTFTTFNDNNETVASDTTMTFSIIEKDGGLAATNIFGGKYEFPVTYSATGISIPFTNASIGEGENKAEVLICGSFDGLSTPPVLFSFGPDDTLGLDNVIYGVNEAHPEGFVALSGSAVKKAKEDPQPTLQPLGEAITDITKLSNEKVYALYNPVKAGSDPYTSKGVFVVYNPDAVNPTYLWSANGEKGQFNSVSVNFSLTDPNHAWMAIQKDGKLYLYNLGTKMFLSTYGYKLAGGSTGPCKFTDVQTPITVETRSDGNLALTSHEDDETSFLCAAPQFATNPISIWTSEDDGSAWVFKENPNLEYDAAVFDNIVTSISSAKTAVGSAPAAVYSLSGVKMGDDDLTKLPKGVYIVNGQKRIVK